VALVRERPRSSGMSFPSTGGSWPVDWGRGDARPVAAMAIVLPPEQVRKARRVLLVIGCLAILAGAAAILVPIVASVTITLFIGWVLMLYGAIAGAHAVTADAPRSARAWRVLHAVLAFLVGFYLVVLPMSGTISLTFLLAVWFFGTGALSLMAAWQHRDRPGAGWMTVNGLLSLALGVLIAANLPSSAGWAIGLLVGIYMIWWGIDALIAASLLKRVLERAQATG
jgi:uncharacterized membrane protein HdeD (DUF308 family)